MRGGIFTIILLLLFHLLSAQKIVDLVKAERLNASLKAVYFQENKGQVHDGYYHPRNDVLFMGITPQQQLIITTKGPSHQLKKLHWKKAEQRDSLFFLDKFHSEFEIEKTEFYRVDMEWLGANPKPEIKKDNPIHGYANYYNVPYAKDGILEVKNFEEVILKNIYHGIDIRYYSIASQNPKEGIKSGIEYDYIISPGSDYKQIQIKISGSEGEVDQEGNLILKTPLGTIAESAPKVFQEGRELKSRWKRLYKDTWGFEIDDYDPAFPVVIDPYIRVWGTYFGGVVDEFVRNCEVDKNENIILTGSTRSTSNIASVGSYQQELNGSSDAFLVFFNSSGVKQWATYYGGEKDDGGNFCKSDKQGNIYLVGTTRSESNIATANAHQKIYNDKVDCFLVKFSDSGIRIWSTYYGGEDYDIALECAVHENRVYITGYTNSKNNIASANGFQTLNRGEEEAFLICFNSEGKRLWGTFYGDFHKERGTSCTTDSLGNVYLTGHSGSSQNIATSGTHNPLFIDAADAFLIKFDSEGKRVWGTYYGGWYNDIPTCCIADKDGNIIVSGYTSSKSMIATEGVHQPEISGLMDGFIAKFNSSGQLLWGTYYGGSEYDFIFNCSTDLSGNIYIAGITNSPNYIAGEGSYQETGGNENDNFLAIFDPLGQRKWSTYYGGEGDEYGGFCAAGKKGNIILVGTTRSFENIATSDAHQNDFGGYYDGYIVKFSCNTTYSTIDTLCSDYTAPDNKTYTTSGIYTAIISNESGCDSIITIHLTIKNPEINIASAKTTCGDSTAIASVNFKEGIAPINYLWLPSGITDSVATDLWSGVHYLIVSDAGGCTRIDSIEVKELKALDVIFQKQIEFHWQNEVPMEVAFFNHTQFYYSGTKAVEYYWSFGDGTTSNTKDPVHTYYEEGIYDVFLISCYANYCCDSAKSTIEVRDSLHIPNVITPNSDGINDFFFIHNPNLNDYHLVIYNRWGQMIFESNNLNESWNGKVFNTGPDCEAGTYFFKLSGKRKNGNEIHERYRKGIVTLLR
jgi:gliding motility-associated-like protein